MAKREHQAVQATDTKKRKPFQGDAKTGRPSLFSEALAAHICGRIAGGETLTAICKTAGLPARETVHRWRREHSQFGLDYSRARIDQMESWSDDVIEIADDSTLDTVTKTDPKGRTYEAVDHENIQRDRLRVDTRKFIMGKIAPRIYGDRMSHEHSGEVHQRHTVELSDRERMRRLATFMVQDSLADQRQPAIIEGSAQPASQSPADIVAGTISKDSADDSDAPG